MSAIPDAVRFAHIKDFAMSRAGSPISARQAQEYLEKKTGQREDLPNVQNTLKKLSCHWKGMVLTNNEETKGYLVYENDRIRAEREKREQEATSALKRERIEAARKEVEDLRLATEAAATRLRELQD